jgi:hypothetical protein
MPVRLCWPVPLFVLRMASEVLVDLTISVSLLARHAQGSEILDETGGGKKALLAINGWARCFDALLRKRFSISEPWELVSVEAEGVSAKVRVI